MTLLKIIYPFRCPNDGSELRALDCTQEPLHGCAVLVCLYLDTAMAETAMQQEMACMRQEKVEIEAVDMKAGMEKINLLHAFPISTWPAINAVRLNVR